ncbi:MAG: hypothetical protein KDJ15_05980 [Alphaproteobacteria bacterium]|nr:hypothetical protein [Alphaproteobacteria bacterium]
MKILYAFSLRHWLCLWGFLVCAGGAPVSAGTTQAPLPVACEAQDTACLFGLLGEAGAAIAEPVWRDQTYRETAKLLAYDGRAEEALALLPLIGNPDTQAMTLRGIGVALAGTTIPDSDKQALYGRLVAAGAGIVQPESRAIALRYVAKGQALAGFDDSARATIRKIDNLSQSDKAFEEVAEVQAKAERLDQALLSIADIRSPAYRDRAHGAVSKICAGRGLYPQALRAAEKIENPYNRGQALLTILEGQILAGEQEAP